jgi:Family of unknown function (DUF6507)
MTSWDIDKVAAWALVRQTRGTARGYGADFKACGRQVTELTGCLTHSTRVAAAVADLTTKVLLPGLRDVGTRTTNAVNGTEAAVGHYDLGNMHMFLNAQRQAAKASYPISMPGRAAALQRPGREPEDRMPAGVTIDPMERRGSSGGPSVLPGGDPQGVMIDPMERRGSSGGPSVLPGGDPQGVMIDPMERRGSSGGPSVLPGGDPQGVMIDPLECHGSGPGSSDASPLPRGEN